MLYHIVNSMFTHYVIFTAETKQSLDLYAK